MPPCRYCTENANESICLMCRTKFENLQNENESLKKQISYLKRLRFLKNQEDTVQLKAKLRRGRK